jgi:hypothetical protein
LNLHVFHFFNLLPKTSCNLLQPNIVHILLQLSLGKFQFHTLGTLLLAWTQLGPSYKILCVNLVTLCIFTKKGCYLFSPGPDNCDLVLHLIKKDVWSSSNKISLAMSDKLLPQWDWVMVWSSYNISMDDILGCWEEGLGSLEHRHRCSLCDPAH